MLEVKIKWKKLRSEGELLIRKQLDLPDQAVHIRLKLNKAPSFILVTYFCIYNVILHIGLSMYYVSLFENYQQQILKFLHKYFFVLFFLISLLNARNLINI